MKLPKWLLKYNKDSDSDENIGYVYIIYRYNNDNHIRENYVSTNKPEEVFKNWKDNERIILKLLNQSEAAMETNDITSFYTIPVKSIDDLIELSNAPLYQHQIIKGIPDMGTIKEI